MKTFLLTVVCLMLPPPGYAAVSVAAASSLRPVLEKVIQEYEKARQQTVQVSYGASGVLVQQILRGAPYQIFVTASDRFIQPLKQAQFICNDPVNLGHGQVVLYIPNASQFALASIYDLSLAIEHGRIKRLALANPPTAPYGAMARQVLENLGVWEMAQPHLTFGESAAQAAQFALTGAVEAAFLPAHLVSGSRLTQQGEVLTIPLRLYKPEIQAVVLLCKHSQEALDFFQYLKQPMIRRRFQDK